MGNSASYIDDEIYSKQSRRNQGEDAAISSTELCPISGDIQELRPCDNEPVVTADKAGSTESTGLLTRDSYISRGSRADCVTCIDRIRPIVGDARGVSSALQSRTIQCSYETKYPMRTSMSSLPSISHQPVQRQKVLNLVAGIVKKTTLPDRCASLQENYVLKSGDKLVGHATKPLHTTVHMVYGNMGGGGSKEPLSTRSQACINPDINNQVILSSKSLLNVYKTPAEATTTSHPPISLVESPQAQSNVLIEVPKQQAHPPIVLAYASSALADPADSLVKRQDMLEDLHTLVEPNAIVEQHKAMEEDSNKSVEMPNTITDQQNAYLLSPNMRAGNVRTDPRNTQSPLPNTQPSAESWLPNPQSWLPTTQSGLHDTHPWFGNTQSWLPHAESWIPNTQYWLPNTPSWLQNRQSWLSNTQSWQPHTQALLYNTSGEPYSTSSSWNNTHSWPCMCTTRNRTSRESQKNTSVPIMKTVSTETHTTASTEPQQNISPESHNVSTQTHTSTSTAMDIFHSTNPPKCAYTETHKTAATLTKQLLIESHSTKSTETHKNAATATKLFTQPNKTKSTETHTSISTGMQNNQPLISHKNASTADHISTASDDRTTGSSRKSACSPDRLVGSTGMGVFTRDLSTWSCKTKENQNSSTFICGPNLIYSPSLGKNLFNKNPLSENVKESSSKFFLTKNSGYTKDDKPAVTWEHGDADINGSDIPLNETQRHVTFPEVSNSDISSIHSCMRVRSKRCTSPVCDGSLIEVSDARSSLSIETSFLGSPPKKMLRNGKISVYSSLNLDDTRGSFLHKSRDDIRVGVQNKPSVGADAHHRRPASKTGLSALAMKFPFSTAAAVADVSGVQRSETSGVSTPAMDECLSQMNHTLPKPLKTYRDPSVRYNVRYNFLS